MTKLRRSYDDFMINLSFFENRAPGTRDELWVGTARMQAVGTTSSVVLVVLSVYIAVQMVTHPLAPVYSKFLTRLISPSCFRVNKKQGISQF